VAGCKQNYLEVFAQVFEDFDGVRADVDAGFNDLSCREFYGEFDVIGRVEGVVAVDEGLVEVEDDCLLV
jgi:hypothetical protein